MANRHSHKKLRVEIRARMLETGESYQAARHRILGSPRRHPAGVRLTGVLAGEVDLIPVTFFGVPLTLATGKSAFFHSVTVVGHAKQSAPNWMPLSVWLRPQGVN
jgi:hypothetical protein